jgi:hypothetical protein
MRIQLAASIWGLEGLWAGLTAFGKGVLVLLWAGLLLYLGYVCGFLFLSWVSFL